MEGIRYSSWMTGRELVL